jgi:hypothetical protein
MAWWPIVLLPLVAGAGTPVALLQSVEPAAASAWTLVGCGDLLPEPACGTRGPHTVLVSTAFAGYGGYSAQHALEYDELFEAEFAGGDADAQAFCARWPACRGYALGNSPVYQFFIGSGSALAAGDVHPPNVRCGVWPTTCTGVLVNVTARPAEVARPLVALSADGVRIRDTRDATVVVDGDGDATVALNTSWVQLELTALRPGATVRLYGVWIGGGPPSGDRGARTSNAREWALASILILALLATGVWQTVRVIRLLVQQHRDRVNKCVDTSNEDKNA